MYPCIDQSNLYVKAYVVRRSERCLCCLDKSSFGKTEALRVRMALLKAVGCMIVLLAVYYSLEKQGYTESLNMFFEEWMDAKLSHAREKRAIIMNQTDFVIEVTVSLSDPDQLKTVLDTFTLPIQISGSSEITNIKTTTVCSPDVAGYQCRCEENFAWSYDNCISQQPCDSIIGNTCGCIKSLPDDGQYCQLNTSQPAPTTPSVITTIVTTTPSLPPLEPVEYDLSLELRIPVASVPSNFIDLFRNFLINLDYPQLITKSLSVTKVNFTTGCYPNSTRGLFCQCEEQYGWSCDQCNTYGTCSNTTSATCSCINSIPSNKQFCQPLTSITPCPPPTAMSTPMTTTPMPTTPMTTTQMPTTPMPTTPMTTTPMPTTPMTTTPMTTTPAPVTMTTTPLITTPPIMTTTPMDTTTTTTEEMTFSFTIDMDFQPEFNVSTNQVYINISNTIQKQCAASISGFKAVTRLNLRSGSTIVEYTVTASAFNDAEINALQSGIFGDLKDTYPIIFDSTEPLTFEPTTVFSGENVIVTCGRQVENLNLDSLTAEWTRDGITIIEDSLHTVSINNGEAKLTVSKAFDTDSGVYECKLKQGLATFRQKSNRKFTIQETPLIQVSPITSTIECSVGKVVSVQCSVQSPYTVEIIGTTAAGSNSVNHRFSIQNCPSSEITFTCQEETHDQFKRTITLKFTDTFDCRNDPVFGNGTDGDVAEVPCKPDEAGEQTAVCSGTEGKWVNQQSNCILKAVQDLLDQSQDLTSQSLPGFLERLSGVTLNSTTAVVESANNINAIVQILDNVAAVSSSSQITVSKNSMQDVLFAVGVLTTDEARSSWDNLNNNKTSPVTRSGVESASSTLLRSVETITNSLTNDSFTINTPFILLNKTAITGTFNEDFDSAVVVDIPDGGSNNITVITFASMDNVLPPRVENNSTIKFINGRVVLLQSSNTINNVSFTFDITNDTLGKPQCVFWNFSLFDGLGGWDDEGCELVSNVNETVTCNCNHLTSFSILMSPNSPDDPVLDIISYIGVGISMASLVICLIIEAVIWRKIRRNNTSYLRHVSIVNIAVSLLIANIWFIIGAAISDADTENPPACTAATFFIHLFYLALFFWMLASGLLLLYRTVNVFDHGLTKKSMLAIGFSLGYGAPLIIATITIAVTASKDEYIRGEGVCWLNWDESRALLAFVIPALLIVVINLLILIVVIYKMLRRRAVSTQADDRHVLLVIIRSLAVLTPFFGITWGLGVGILTNPNNRGIHISFAFFNSLQGFFILVFGTLLDKKVRSELAPKSASSSATKTTSAGNSSSSGLGFFRNLRRGGRDGYNLSSNLSDTPNSIST
ncbi:adhesion G protein-coupled receptor F5-like [Scomber scombrus]|uniref:Adhesion G protein-coupled receptor F5-like n=1 Tax=Scomber scombrus TaxID=13677 RepID=A0AAV1PI37_SCOSC